jgi:hypothetical protein
VTPRIALVGAGFLGSLFAEELAKRLFAFEFAWEALVIDDDTVDARNPANALYTLRDIRALKAEVLAARLRLYGVPSVALPARVGREHPITSELLACALVVDAVDNLPTRQWLWELAVAHGVPVLHLGVSQGGTGAVEWTTPVYDSFSLSPVVLADRTPTATADAVQLVTLPPCELVGMRGVGLNLAVAGAKAVAIALGFDAERAAPPAASNVLTTWSATNTSHTLVEVHRA